MKRFVLVCSGGGVRGILSLQFLSRLELHLGTPLFTMVDLVCGTSTGGFIATGISTGMSCDEILNTFYTRENAEYIFSNKKYLYYFGLTCKYSDKPKKHLLENTFQKKTIHDVSIPLLIPTYNDTLSRLFCWSSIEMCNAYLKDILNATSAAPLYFPTAKVHMVKPKRTDFINIQNILPNNNDIYIDGGVSENDPCVLAYAYAKKIYPDDDIYVLSVGTGKSHIIENKDTKNPGLLEWLKHGFFDIIMDGAEYTHVIELELLLGNKFLYCDLPIDNNTMDDTSKKNIDNLINQGDIMWNNYVNHIDSFFNTLIN
jgi:uncharacterized protein